MTIISNDNIISLDKPCLPQVRVDDIIHFLRRENRDDKKRTRREITADEISSSSSKKITKERVRTAYPLLLLEAALRFGVSTPVIAAGGVTQPVNGATTTTNGDERKQGKRKNNRLGGQKAHPM